MVISVFMSDKILLWSPRTILSSTMVALFYILTHRVHFFTFQFKLELPRGKIYNLRCLFLIKKLSTDTLMN